MKVSRMRRATFRPSVVFPLQLKPTRIKLSMGLLESTEVRQRLVEAIPAELEPKGIGQNQRDHRFANDPSRWQHADVAALDVRYVPLTRGVVDRRERVDQRRDRL